MTCPSYLVVGGGISGLAAAVGITDADPGAQVTVLEGRDRVGGKLRGHQVAGRHLDVGAEAVLARPPEAVELIGRAGLHADVVHPVGASAQVWSRGSLHPISPPVLATVRGGLHRLPQALADLLTEQGVTIRTDTLARELHALPEGGYEVVTGPRPAPTVYRADRVVLALPPTPTARLLARTVPEAAQLLATVETASTAVVTLALPAEALGELTFSGVLVPEVEDLRIRAATFSSTAWAWVREAGRGAGPAGEDLTFLRASIGRHRQEATLQRPDADLVEVVRADLARVLGHELPAHVDAHVQRWGGALPQYAARHVELVEQVRAAVDRVPGLAVCGATYDGVDIPACIASARRAVARLTAHAPTSRLP